MRVFVASLVAASCANAETVVPIFGQNFDGVEKAFNTTYDSYMADFPAEAHAELMKMISDVGVESFLESTAYIGAPSAMECAGSAGGVALPSKMAAAPGGITKRIFGMDLAKLVDKLASKASGAAGASGAAPGLLAAQAIATGAGMMKASMSTLVQIVPRFVPNYKPLSCMPMVTGHNCFGAVQYPITAADFVTADTTDATLDGVIAGFPTLYKRKVGTTSDAAYKACFSAFMGMHCGSLFPRCSQPQAGQAERLPLCFTSCLATLVACPGFWVEDILGECTNVSVPPMCTMSVFANFWLLPPQYTSYESSLPTAQSCPSVPASLSAAASGLSVYDDNSILASAYGAGRLPVA